MVNCHMSSQVWPHKCSRLTSNTETDSFQNILKYSVHNNLDRTTLTSVYISSHLRSTLKPLSVIPSWTML